MLVRQPCRRRKPRTQARYGNLRADMRPDVVPLRTGMATRGPIETIAIEQRKRGHLHCDGAFYQCLRLGASLQERKGASGVKLDIALSHRGPPSASDFAKHRAPCSNKASLRPAPERQDPTARPPTAWGSTSRRLPSMGHKRVRR